ncbi:hypothetical protein [Halalkalibacter krulwichiae]|uniref:hypothetical protein n=1 Tax=Halalkalibacter krulwichiae TaxID=199441 RepID=UPI000825A05B|nr:hypothetical protein [Halalkalibacter krulwichiae]
MRELWELGVPADIRAKVYGMAADLKTGENDKFIYFDKESLKCRVKYRNLTKARLLRLPSFVEFA